MLISYDTPVELEREEYHEKKLKKCVDTRVCTCDLIKENDLNDHSCTQKIMIALHASIHSLHIIKRILRF